MVDSAPQVTEFKSLPDVDTPAKSREWIHSIAFEAAPTLLILVNVILLFVGKNEASTEVILVSTIAISNLLLIFGNFRLNKFLSNYHKTRDELDSQIALNEIENEYHQKFIDRLLSDTHSLNTEISKTGCR